MDPIYSAMMDPKLAPNLQRIVRFGVAKLHQKKGKFYVSVKVPGELRHMFAEPRIRRSTGVCDRKIAEIVAVSKADEIYRQLEQAYQQLDPFIEAIRPLLSEDGINVSSWYLVGQIQTVLTGTQTQSYERLGVATMLVDGKAEPIRETWVASSYLQVAKLLQQLGKQVPHDVLHLLKEQGVELKDLEEQKTITPKETFQLASVVPKFFAKEEATPIIENLSKAPQRKVAKKITGSGQFKFSHIVDEYLARKSGDTAESQRRKACERAIEFIGDLPVVEYDRAHAYDWAKSMHEAGVSSAQIKKMIRYAAGVLECATTVRGSNGAVALKANPWQSLDLRDFGKKQESYLPFTSDELEKIFAQEMPQQEFKLLCMMVTTGMRLDEAALMTWERIISVHEVLCFSLRKKDGDDVRVKNKAAERLIPVPPILFPIIGERSTGRLFEYPLDSKGKAQTKASDAVMPILRNISKNKLKVAHSLRGNFKDLLREYEAPLEEANYLMGHTLPGMGSIYGEGPPVKNLKPIIDRIKHPWIFNIV